MEKIILIIGIITITLIISIIITSLYLLIFMFIKELINNTKNKNNKK